MSALIEFIFSRHSWYLKRSFSKLKPFGLRSTIRKFVASLVVMESPIGLWCRGLWERECGSDVDCDDAFDECCWLCVIV